MQQLTNLISIFNKKLFRIPDYQRGYAWRQSPQLTDFWEDINTLAEGKSHYTGVLSLEQVAQTKWNDWEEDKWLIDNKGYAPFFIVDGQQRIATCIILIQAIIEVAKELPENKLPNREDFEICDTKLSDIKREFIFQQRSNSILRSYVFGYEKDNPSYEFLKTQIFCEESSSDQRIETLYTQNMENAKKFFKENLLMIPETERKKRMEDIYRKVTQHLLFNEYIIESEVDVCVAFETMNNRGKKLSDLELLKNRLVYLTTLYKEDDAEKNALRRKINDAWKEIYHQLGRNKASPLNDDDFLRAHWIMYFKYSRKTGKDYIHFLLNEKFSAKQVLEQVPVYSPIEDATEVRDIDSDDLNSEEEEEDIAVEQKYQSKLTIKEISDYAASIQTSAGHWYNTFNPLSNTSLTRDEQNWIDRLNRIGISYFRPLVMSSFVNKHITSNERIRLYKAIERFIFVVFRLSQARANYGNSVFYSASRELARGTMKISDIIKELDERMSFVFNDDGSYKLPKFQEFIIDKFKYETGFYGWSGLRYFLYEYETSLFEKSKNKTQKIIWERFVNKEDSVTIEHILPQTPDKPCWKAEFRSYTKRQINILTNTLGNLLALSSPKNSSLQNDCYSDKRADRNAEQGYFNGSYSESRVAEMYEDWTAENIKERGLELLGFIETRWNIKLGDEDEKIKLLNLQFLQERQQ